MQHLLNQTNDTLLNYTLRRLLNQQGAYLDKVDSVFLFISISYIMEFLWDVIVKMIYLIRKN